MLPRIVTNPWCQNHKPNHDHDIERILYFVHDIDLEHAHAIDHEEDQDHDLDIICFSVQDLCPLRADKVCFCINFMVYSFGFFKSR